MAKEEMVDYLDSLLDDLDMLAVIGYTVYAILTEMQAAAHLVSNLFKLISQKEYSEYLWGQEDSTTYQQMVRFKEALEAIEKTLGTDLGKPGEHPRILSNILYKYEVRDIREYFDNLLWYKMPVKVSPPSRPTIGPNIHSISGCLSCLFAFIWYFGVRCSQSSFYFQAKKVLYAGVFYLLQLAGQKPHVKRLKEVEGHITRLRRISDLVELNAIEEMLREHLVELE